MGTAAISFCQEIRAARATEVTVAAAGEFVGWEGRGGLVGWSNVVEESEMEALFEGDQREGDYG